MDLNGNVIIPKPALIKILMMNKYFLMNKYLIILLLIPGFSFSQVIIGSGKSKMTNSSVSLEFGTEPKGILLPWVESANIVQNAVAGTFIFDVSDKKVKLRSSTGWIDLTINSDGEVDTTLQDPHFEKVDAKVTVGVPTNVNGIFVLEDNNKGMILPLVNSYKEVINPDAGMMVFDTSSKQLCLFNGKFWTFWKG